jgi:hypothetical protein
MYKVSDWNEGFLENFLDSLRHDQHPFTEVIVMRPIDETKEGRLKPRFIDIESKVKVKVKEKDEEDEDETESGGERTVEQKINKYSISVRDVNRVKEDYMDWCEAPVESEYFMYVNSYFHVRKYVDLLITKDEKPLVRDIYIHFYFIYITYDNIL